MARKRATLLLGLVTTAIGFSGGCASYDPPTDPQRAQSFAPYHDLKIGGEPAEAFVSARTALLIPGDFVDSAREKDAWVALHIRTQPNVTVDGPAQAIAIDPRGYFLTADHCLNNHPKVTLVFHSVEGLRVATARVVARLHDEDTAILAVNSPLPKTFEWQTAESLRVGDPLLSIGVGDPGVTGNVLFLKRHCLAGTIQGLEPLTDDGAESVRHTLPLRAGDSGGPAVSLDGRLIGIDSHATARPLSAPTLYCVRPNPASISRLIDADLRDH